MERSADRTDKTTKMLLALIALALWGLLLRPLFTSAAPAQAQAEPMSTVGPATPVPATPVPATPIPGTPVPATPIPQVGSGRATGTYTIINQTIAVGDSLFITYQTQDARGNTTSKIKAYRVREVSGGIRLDETVAKDLPSTR